MAPAVLEIPIGTHVWVFPRNETGGYEYTFGYLRCVVYRDSGQRHWNASVYVQAPDPSIQYKEDGVGVSPERALFDALRALRPRIDTMAMQVMDYRDFLRMA